MPYQYVLEGILYLNMLEREFLHNVERPIGYLAFQNAELNRDSKKRKKPFSPEEFYFYADKDQEDLPEPRYGAAAKELIRQGLFPTWALFVYKDLKSRAADALPPELLCFACDDAIVLAPDIDGRIMTGMLIGAETASRQRRTMTSPCGKQIDVELPLINGKFAADEESEMLILAQHF